VRATTDDSISRIGNFSEIPGLPVISKVVVHRGLVYTSGVTGDPGHDVAAQTQQALDRVDELLGLAHSNRSRILSAQVWLADMADFSAHNVVWDRWVDPANPPARACVGAQLYQPDILVEIRVIATVEDDDSTTTEGQP
jgi:enamine deaminase RidA (YjgF/YER057c/UK114 family)